MDITKLSDERNLIGTEIEGLIDFFLDKLGADSAFIIALNGKDLTEGENYPSIGCIKGNTTALAIAITNVLMANSKLGMKVMDMIGRYMMEGDNLKKFIGHSLKKAMNEGEEHE